jgi:hypothetical protein
MALSTKLHALQAWLSDGLRDGLRDGLGDWLRALQLSLLTAAASYPTLRMVQAWRFPEPDPATVIWNTRIALFWRVAIVFYFGCLLLPVFRSVVQFRPSWSRKAIWWLLATNGVLYVVQSWRIPLPNIINIWQNTIGKHPCL